MRQVTQTVVGGVAELPEEYLAIWHGFTPALLLSATAILGGLVWLAGSASWPTGNKIN